MDPEGEAFTNGNYSACAEMMQSTTLRALTMRAANSAVKRIPRFSSNESEPVPRRVRSHSMKPGNALDC